MQSPVNQNTLPSPCPNCCPAPHLLPSSSSFQCASWVRPVLSRAARHSSSTAPRSLDRSPGEQLGVRGVWVGVGGAGEGAGASKAGDGVCLNVNTRSATKHVCDALRGRQVS